MKPLILASASPYRRALLQRIHLPFTSRPANINEAREPGESGRALAVRLAEGKAMHIAGRERDGLVIGSDQVAELGDLVLGKPGDRQTAFRQLQAASGRAVRFHTAVCLIASDVRRSHVDLTTVHFRDLKDAEIDAYLRQEDALDCAGSFKAEGLGIALFERIENTDPTALVGLPMIWLSRALIAEGYPILS